MSFALVVRNRSFRVSFKAVINFLRLTAPALMVFGECLPSFMCETECKLLFSSAQASLPYTIDFNSCNSTCCDTDLCNRYGPENITVPGKIKLGLSLDFAMAVLV